MCFSAFMTNFIKILCFTQMFCNIAVCMQHSVPDREESLGGTISSNDSSHRASNPSGIELDSIPRHTEPLVDDGTVPFLGTDPINPQNSPRDLQSSRGLQDFELGNLSHPDLVDTVRKLSAKVSELEAKSSGIDVLQWTKTFVELGQEIKKIDSVVGEMKNRLDALENRLGGINSNITTIHSRIDTINHTMSRLDGLAITATGVYDVGNVDIREAIHIFSDLKEFAKYSHNVFSVIEREFREVSEMLGRSERLSIITLGRREELSISICRPVPFMCGILTLSMVFTIALAVTPIIASLLS